MRRRGRRGWRGCKATSTYRRSGEFPSETVGNQDEIHSETRNARFVSPDKIRSTVFLLLQMFKEVWIVGYPNANVKGTCTRHGHLRQFQRGIHHGQVGTHPSFNGSTLLVTIGVFTNASESHFAPGGVEWRLASVRHIGQRRFRLRRKTRKNSLDT